MVVLQQVEGREPKVKEVSSGRSGETVPESVGEMLEVTRDLGVCVNDDRETGPDFAIPRRRQLQLGRQGTGLGRVRVAPT